MAGNIAKIMAYCGLLRLGGGPLALGGSASFLSADPAAQLFRRNYSAATFLPSEASGGTQQTPVTLDKPVPRPVAVPPPCSK